MFALLQIVALCTATDAASSYTIHVRGLTVPERTLRRNFGGSDRVADAVAALPRPADADEMDLWLAWQDKSGAVRILRIDWTAISKRGATATNYILFAGDRLFVQARPAK